MIHSLTLAPRLLAQIAFPSPAATKMMAELAMALHYFRQSYAPGDLADEGIAAIETALASRLMQDAHLALLANPFLTAQALTPYVFLRGAIAPLAPYEQLLAELSLRDDSLREATPYRRMERAYLLAKLGKPLPGWRTAPILHDARRAWAFSRDVSYAFTHTVLFATDFAAIRRPDPFVKGVAQLCLAVAHAEADLDLFWELALCLTTQDLSPADLAGLLHLCVDLRDRFGHVFDAPALESQYHPVFVHDILRGRMLHRFGIDILTAPSPGPSPLYGQLLALQHALAGKDAARIVAAHAALPTLAWSGAMVRDRLSQLRRLARREVLFLRELGPSHADQPELYRAYTNQIGGFLARLTSG